MYSPSHIRVGPHVWGPPPRERVYTCNITPNSIDSNNSTRIFLFESSNAVNYKASFKSKNDHGLGINPNPTLLIYFAHIVYLQILKFDFFNIL